MIGTSGAARVEVVHGLGTGDYTIYETDDLGQRFVTVYVAGRLVRETRILAWGTRPKFGSNGAVSNDAVAIAIREFKKERRARFPFDITVLPMPRRAPRHQAGKPVVHMRARAAVKERVPVRSRRKLRVWERP